MDYSVVIPTNRSHQAISPLLTSLLQQTVSPQEIIIVVDRYFGDHAQEQEYRSALESLLSHQQYTIITHRSHGDFVPGQGASYVRNYGFRTAESDYILAIDDDNILDQTMMSDLRDAYISLGLHEQGGVVIPTELYRDTDQIRSQGYSSFGYWLGRVRPEPIIIGPMHKPIAFAASNCLFGPRDLFITHGMDESIPFVYEDFEWTHRLSRSGVPLYALTTVYTHHMMRSKTPLQDSYLDNPRAAYHKAKHRILRVKSTATQSEKIQYYLLGLHLHTAALIYKILRYAPITDRLPLLRAIIRGTVAGLFSSYRHS